MDKYINKNEAYKLLKHEEETHDLSFSAEAYKRAARIIDQMPTVDAEPVRHSKWVAVGKPYRVHDVMLQNYKCRDCKESMATRPDNLINYCPNCGAKMDGGTENA